jgi:phosphate transport system substrate-binding protein
MISLAIFAAPAFADTPPPSVQVRGSSIFLPVMQLLAERYMAEHAGTRIVVGGGGSWWGFKTVFDGTASLGMVSGDTVPEDLDEQGREQQKSLSRRTFGRFAVVPVVHPGNTLTSLSHWQLHEIFVGHITNWKEVGGPNAPIHVVAAEDVGSGIFQVWTNKVLGEGVVITPSAREVAAAEMRNAVSHDPLSIGYEALGRLTANVKALKVDGVQAGEDSLADGRWPVSGAIALVYAEPLSGPAKSFLDFCLGDVGKAQIATIHGAFMPEDAR